MEKLDKVIAGLEMCSGENVCCSGCPYEEYEYCDVLLTKDALAVIRDLQARLKSAKDGRLLLSRRCRELEQKLSWLEPRTAPNDWGEYPPEFPREGM